MMMYIVTHVCDEEYGNTENVAVFATRDQANAFVNAHNSTYHAWFMEQNETRPTLNVEEWEVGTDVWEEIIGD